MPAAAPAMIYVRGHRRDFDGWRDTYACPGWGYADLLPYFRRAEEQLSIEEPRYLHPLHRAWVWAARAYGLAGHGDLSAGEPGSAGYYRLMQRAGRRWPAADAYLRPAAARRNLTVVTGAQVSRVLVERGRAVGVRCQYGGAQYEARAAAEVVLCGGAVNTPQLLMLSGIGPAGHLRRHGIEVVADAAQVGTGLQDHPLSVVMWYTPRTRGIWEEATEADIDRRRDGPGPMASLGVEAGGFARTAPALPAPDVQFHVVPAPVGDSAQLPPDLRVVSVLVSALDVESRGRVRLRSADPSAPPTIDPGYLTAESDLAVLAAGIRQAREIASHSPLAGLVAGELAPGEPIEDKDQLRAWIRRTVSTTHHPTSSCAMGGTRGSACDPELRVRGVDRLRVVDASVMPAVPRGNPNAPTIAVAERAADLIRGNRPLTSVID
jgi:choline dehydrogenase